MRVFGEPSNWRADLAAAVMFLTRLPVSGNAGLNSAMRAFPLAGVVIGVIMAAVLAVLAWLGVPDMLAALGALCAGTLVCGGLHEDGLADTADGFGAPAARARKLEIMHDSRIGAFGVLALIFVKLAQILALGTLVGGGIGEAALALISATVLSRLAMVILAYTLGPARADGQSAAMGQPDDDTVLQAALSGVVISALTAWWAAGLGATVISLTLVAGACGVMRWQARRNIGGQTGDVLGALQQIAEAVVLTALASAV